MDGENNGKPPKKGMIWGKPTIFGNVHQKTTPFFFFRLQVTSTSLVKTWQECTDLYPGEPFFPQHNSNHVLNPKKLGRGDLIFLRHKQNKHKQTHFFLEGNPNNQVKLISAMNSKQFLLGGNKPLERYWIVKLDLISTQVLRVEIEHVWNHQRSFPCFSY